MLCHFFPFNTLQYVAEIPLNGSSPLSAMCRCRTAERYTLIVLYFKFSLARYTQNSHNTLAHWQWGQPRLLALKKTLLSRLICFLGRNRQAHHKIFAHLFLQVSDIQSGWLITRMSTSVCGVVVGCLSAPGTCWKNRSSLPWESALLLHCPFQVNEWLLQLCRE